MLCQLPALTGVARGRDRIPVGPVEERVLGDVLGEIAPVKDVSELVLELGRELTNGGTFDVWADPDCLAVGPHRLTFMRLDVVAHIRNEGEAQGVGGRDEV